MNLKLLVVVAMLASSPAFAADTGFFVAGSAGQVHAKTTTTPGFSANDSYSTWALGGGYRFNQYFGIEASYRDYGSLKVDGPGGAWSRGNLTGWTYGGLVAYQVTDTIELTARAGWNRWQSDWKNSGGGSGTNHGTEPYYGIGAAWVFDNRMAAVLNVTRFKSAYASTDDADVFEIGLQYRF